VFVEEEVVLSRDELLDRGVPVYNLAMPAAGVVVVAVVVLWGDDLLLLLLLLPPPIARNIFVVLFSLFFLPRRNENGRSNRMLRGRCSFVVIIFIVLA
jgi:hypothetical protein